MGMERVLRYIDTKSKDYSRAFSNSTIVTSGPFGEIVVDFCEETLVPFLPVEQDLAADNETTRFTHEPDVIVVERERKFSVTMTKEQALKMADWIYAHCGRAGDNE